MPHGSPTGKGSRPPGTRSQTPSRWKTESPQPPPPAYLCDIVAASQRQTEKQQLLLSEGTGRDAGLVNYSPASACHQSCGLFQADRAAACPPARLSSVGSDRIGVFYLGCCSLPLLVSKPRDPPKLFRRRYQRLSHLPHQTAEPSWGFPPSHRESEPWIQMAGASFFLAVAPSFSSTLVHAFVFQRFPLRLSFLSVLPAASDPSFCPACRVLLRLLLFFFSLPLQQALAATSLQAWITKDTRLTPQ
uniref:Uncharacterized protein n=1 Tax=Pipistrellus kuhlii TaxID=59472 RepID=A0A7J7V0G1_PIPKU|nr:hypothetical protein mPipKuh1_008637 [Pipistrellus kuhlii]